MTGPFTGSADDDLARTNYANRLATRRDALPALNRLVALAAHLMGAGSGQVSLLGDVQSVMAGVGDAAASVGVESPAEDSLCTVTLRAGVPVSVVDAPRDPRVNTLPPVTAGVVGSYLGVPLVVGGHTVGALCVFDRAAREWSAEDISVLEQLGGPVAAELELASLEASYDDDRLLWQLAVDAAGVGVFDWDLTTGELRWDDRLLGLFGLDRATFGGTIGAFNETVHPDDRDRVTRALSGAIETVGTFAAEYRVSLPDGRVRWISARGQALAGAEGHTTRVIGAAYDTTATVDAEARVARVFEAMPTAFFHLDQSWLFTYANAAAERLLGGIGVPVVGHQIWELFPAAVGSDFERHYRQAVETGLPVEFEAYYPPPLDRFYEVRAWPTPDGLSVYFLDVTERRAAQDAVAGAARRDAFLAEVTLELTETLDVEEAVSRLAQLVVPALGDWCVVSLVGGGGPASGTGWRRRLQDIGSWHHDPGSRALVARYAELRIRALTDESFVARALDDGVWPVLVPAGAAERVIGFLDPGEAHDVMVELDPSSMVMLPLRGRGRTVGLLTVFRGPDRETFSEEDLATLGGVASRAGLALGTARTFGEQRELAEGLQRSLLTEPPEPDHLQLVVRYEPAAEAAQVGGDWYDAFLQSDGATTIVIGDVIGHDTEAAAAMGQVRSLLRGIAVTTGDGPAGVLSNLDRAIEVLQVGTSATAVVARLEQTSDERERGLTRLRWSNAGHPPPLVVLPRADGTDGVGAPADGAAADGSGGTRFEVRVLWPEESELMLGYDATTVRTESELVMRRGGTVLLYTDGLVERRSELIDVGIEALRVVVSELVEAGVGLEDLCTEVLARVRAESHEDDVALVAVRLHLEDRPQPEDRGPSRGPRDD